MMKQDYSYSTGTPCWVDTLQPDPRAALGFYGPLLGWTFDEATRMPDGLEGEYFAARVEGRLVAGIGQALPGSPALWSTYISVEAVEQTVARATEAGGVRIVGPLDAGSDGRLAVLADPTHVPFCLWQVGGRAGAEITGAPGTWAMSSLHTTDLEQARAFYGRLFGWELETAPGASFSQWRLADKVVAVATTTDGDAVPPHWSVNFAVRDVDAAAERATDLGGTVVIEPMDTPGFRNTVIADPQGGVIAMSARAPAGGVYP